MADAEAIAAVHIASWVATYEGRRPDHAHRTYVWTWRLREPEPGRHTVVAVEGRSVIGFVHFGPSPDSEDDPAVVGHVFSLHVDPEHARRGVGRRLLDRAESAFRASGRVVATLWVVSANRPARRFYDKAGWRPDGTARRETLALEGEPGEEVDVVRYRIRLHAAPGGDA
ncbi:MAG: GNAT family N-acetyltransferase [Acidimicrobiales bacterium]